jgi:hypothetical protein
LYHTVQQQLTRLAPATPPASLTRLALLVTGIVAARTCVLARIAAELSALAVTGTTRADSIGRRLRRTLNDAHLQARDCYTAIVPSVLGWSQGWPDDQPVVLALDESSHRAHLHLLRLSVTYRGGSVPLAWALWPQNTPLPPGAYWDHVDRVLAAAAAQVPRGVPVVVVADRAYAVPAFIDRLHRYGWHWVIRVSSHGAHRWQDATGREHALAEVVATQVPAPGRRWRTRGAFAKKAGWRTANLVAVWGRTAAEPLVVLTDLPPAWQVLRLYERRFWIEAGFRADKRAGWQWEASQVRDQDHQQVLLVALAWASLLALCLGAERAAQRLADLTTRPTSRRPWRPTHARLSLCSLGIEAIRAWLYHGRATPFTWQLPQPTGPSWSTQWRASLSSALIFHPPVRP